MSEPAPPPTGPTPEPVPPPRLPAGGSDPFDAGNTGGAGGTGGTSEESGFTVRAVSLGFVLLAAWVFVINSSYPDNYFRLQQLVMLMGFGALLTLFFVKFLTGLLPAALRLRPPETAVFFTMLLIGIPSSMLGRLALESATVNHIAEWEDTRSGKLGFMPAHWAPEAHVRLPEHRGMVEPLSAAEAATAAATGRAASIEKAAAAAQRASATAQTVVLKYVFLQKPGFAGEWDRMVASIDAEGWRQLGLAADCSAGSLLIRLREILNGPRSAADAEPAWRRQGAELVKQFDAEKTAAIDIFAPLTDVAEDARRFATYARESDRCPRAQIVRARAIEAAKAANLDEAGITAAEQAAVEPVAREEAFRAALAGISCAESLDTASADILTRLSELADNYAAIQGIYKGEGKAATYAVPWKLWIVPMLYWGGVMLAFHGLAFAFLLSMRKVWVEAERLPFPYAILPERLERGVPAGPGIPEQQSVFPRWWLYAPFLIGLAFCLPACFAISAQTINPPAPGPIDNMKDLSIEGWDIKLNLDTWTLALILLFPLDLIFSALLFFFIGAYAVPYLAKLCGVEGFGQNLIPYQMLRMGGFLGLFLGTVWFNRRTMRQLITGCAVAGGGEAEQAAAARDPLKPRMVTALFWSCLVLLGILLTWGETGGGVLKTLLLLFGLFVVVVYNFQEWRIRAEGGFVAWDFNNIMKVQTWSNWYVFGLRHTNQDPGTQLPLPESQAAWQQLYNTALLGSYVPTLGPGAYFLEAFRVGDIFRASPKAILKAAVLAFLFALVVGMPIYLACSYHFGLEKQPGHALWSNFGHSTDKVFRYYMKRGDGGPFGTASASLSGWAFLQDLLFGNNWRNTFLWTVAGAACVIAIMYYRRNLARFPLHPLGFVIAGTGNCSTQMDMSNIWFGFLLAFLIKWVIHDWFGVRVFRNKVEPGITYWILGLCTGILIYVVLVVVKLQIGVTWLERGG